MSTIEERIYSGILGKAIGVRLGAPIEPYQWDYKRILASYGEIKGYVKDSHRFAADDDTNGPIFFIRTLIDQPSRSLTSEHVGQAWLNYARDGQGMFWWGGEGISTEHTAYQRMVSMIKPPMSGSSLMNTKALSEQVGGQIFIDSWGWIHLGDIDKAIKDAQIAAAVSHDGEALVGAGFIAGMIAGAYNCKDLKSLIQVVLAKLDASSEYVRVACDIYGFYQKHPEDFRKAYQYVVKHYSYDHYEGACHIIPNACLVLIGLLYGEGRFDRSIEITCMCGWDTDSNAGVVGSILGVYCGLEGMADHYREPINDILIASSMSPTLNVVSLPDFALLLASLSKGEIKEKHHIHLQFPFEGSSCGLQVRNDFRLVKDKITQKSKDGLDLLIDNLVLGDEASIYLQTFYQKTDFGDNRYDPVFAPLVYSKQVMTMDVVAHIDFIDELYGTLYMRLCDGTEMLGESIHLAHQSVQHLSYPLPDTKGKIIKEVGIKLKCNSEPIDGNGLLGRIKIRNFEIKGLSEYTINHHTFENSFLNHVTPFSNQRIETKIKDKGLKFTSKKKGISITGDYFTKNVEIATQLFDINGGKILVSFRVKGLENYYSLEITPETLSVIHRFNQEEMLLATSKISLNFSDTIEIHLKIVDAKIEASVNGTRIEYDGLKNEYGHFGFGVEDGSIMLDCVEVKTL